jgi:pimeloyl-ACP methyl ester carboxylesterase
MPVATCVRLVATTLRHPSRILDSMSAGAWVLHADLEPLFRVVAASLPAAVVWGASDRLLPSWQGRRMAELLDAPFIEVAGDHDWPLRDPRRFAATITALSADCAAGLHQRRQRSLPGDSTLERTG